MTSTYKDNLIRHYQKSWHQKAYKRFWRKGPFQELPSDFCVLEFPPTKDRVMWTYATCCMSQPIDKRKVEVHLFAQQRSDELVELLTVVAHFHRTGAKLDLGHTVDFGRGWILQSKCDHGLISLPYLDGTDLENANIQQILVKCFWLIPITKEEVEYKKKHGLEALEKLFEQSNFNYLDPNRLSVVRVEKGENQGGRTKGT